MPARKRRNIEMGFYDPQGRFHPIRASSDYDEEEVGFHLPKRKKRKKPAARKRKNPLVRRGSKKNIPKMWKSAKVRRVGNKVQILIP